MSTGEVKRVLRSPREIRKMRAAGLVVWQAHQAGAKLIEPGMTTAEIDQAYVDMFVHYDAEPLFLGYGGAPDRPPFPAVTCMSVNEEVVHGIPNQRKLKEGDILSVDTGCRISNWCGDAAVTHAVGKVSSQCQKLLTVTQATLDLAIDLMASKSRWSEISKEMEQYVHGHGFSVVEDMVGHGIGQNLHEPPQVPNYYSKEWADKEDFDLRPGVVLAIEPMINAGVNDLIELDDGWTTISADKKPSAHFEHTVAMTKDGPVRLTGPPNDEELQALPEWLHDKSQWLKW